MTTENPSALLAKLETYGFKCEAGPLHGCVDWQALRTAVLDRAPAIGDRMAEFEFNGDFMLKRFQRHVDALISTGKGPGYPKALGGLLGEIIKLVKERSPVVGKMFERPAQAYLSEPPDTTNVSGPPLMIGRRTESVLPVQAHPVASDELERIAESWDGCTHEGHGELVDIGESLRESFAALAATQPAAAPAGKVAMRDALRRSGANPDYHGLIAFTPAQLHKFVGMLAAAPSPQPANQAGEPDMLWLADDSEIYGDSASDFAETYAGDFLGVGETQDVLVDCAIRARRRTMRIALVDKGDDESEVAWEWVEVGAQQADGGGA